MALLLAPSLADQISRSLFDDTFAGIHQLSWFDWSLLIPYFALLVVLSCYGLHRLEVVRVYRKFHKRIPREPARRFAELPPVTIQLPLYNERYVVERLLEEVSKIDYPRHLLQIQVLDDSSDDTHPFTEALVAWYRAAGLPIEYHHRDSRAGYKAGALQEGLKTATGEFIAIFDADFLPPPDFLLRTVHFFTDPRIGVVQTRWGYVNRDYNVLTEVQAMLLDGHFVLEHGARCGRGLFFNFNGTAGMLRRRMIDDAGGWQADTLVEDCDLSYRAQLKGWRFTYVVDVECPSELPVEMYGFQVQQARWAKGLTQLAMKLLPTILRAPVSKRIKAEAILHLTPNISYPMMIAVAGLLLPVMIVRFYMGWFQMLVIDLPLVIANFWSIWAFYIMAYRELHPTTWKRSLVLMPALMSAGVALTLCNGKSVIEALCGRQGSFTRTPKFAIQARGAGVVDEGYRWRSGWLPYLELAMGTGFIGIAAYAIDTYNFLALPFLLLFVAGYYWAGFSTLYQEYRFRLRWHRQRRLALETAR